MKRSTPRFTHRPSNVSWITATMLDLPARGAPFRTTICPATSACLARVHQRDWRAAHGLREPEPLGIAERDDGAASRSDPVAVPGRCHEQPPRAAEIRAARDVAVVL